MFKKTTLWFIALLFLFTFALSAAAQDEVVTNSEVITLTKAGLDKAVIINKINSSKTNFNLSTTELAKLKEAGVSDDVVSAMQSAKNTTSGTPSTPTAAAPRTENKPAVGLSQSAGAYPKVYVAPMDEGFNNFIVAEIINQKLPVLMATTDEGADYVITGTSVKGTNKWYDTVFGGEKDRNQGSIQMIKIGDKSIAWAGSQGDRSLWWGTLAKTGQKKVAQRLIKNLKKDFFRNQEKR